MPNDLEDEFDTSELFSTTVYEPAPKPSRPFLPWHRPRKQYVRGWQWAIEILKVASRIEEDRSIRYLGLPGSDLLDIRYFHEKICLKVNKNLRFLGFNRAASPTSANLSDLSVSLDEVRKLTRIDPESDIIGDDFNLLANDKSLAWRRVRDFGPYDVVNIDLCDGFAVGQPGGLGVTNYNAIAKLFSLQSKHKSPWLLFLTTRVGRQDVNDKVFATLVAKFKTNLAECEEFRSASEADFEIKNDEELTEAALTDLGFSRVFLSGISKWLLGLSLGANNKLRVESVMGYNVFSNTEVNDLVTLAFRFEPVFNPLPDQLGLAAHDGQNLDECEEAVHIVNKIAGITCVDTLLANDKELLDVVVEQSIQLLKSARYNPDDYLAWLAQ